MYICEDCGATFEEPRVYNETYGVDGPPQPIHCCPACGGDYREAAVCTMCGKHFIDEEFQGICDDCQQDILKKLEQALMDKFLPEEVEFLRNRMAG